MKQVVLLFIVMFSLGHLSAQESGKATAPAAAAPAPKEEKTSKAPPQVLHKRKDPKQVAIPEMVTKAQLADFPANAVKRWRKVNQFQFDTEWGVPSNEPANMDGDIVSYYVAHLTTDSGQDDNAVYDGTGKLIRYSQWLPDGDLPVALKASLEKSFKGFEARKVRVVSEKPKAEAPLFYLVVLQKDKETKTVTLGPDGAMLKELSHKKPAAEGEKGQKN